MGNRSSLLKWLLVNGLLAVSIIFVFVWGLLQFLAFPNINRIAQQNVENDANQFIRLIESKTKPHNLDLAAQVFNAKVHLIKDSQIAAYPRNFPANNNLLQDAKVREYNSSNLIISEIDDKQYLALSRLQDGTLFYFTQPFPSFKELAYKDTALILSISSLLTLLGLGLFSWLTYQKVIRPLKNITQTAHRINEGFLEDEIRFDTESQEFQELGLAFNKMADRFRADINNWKRMNAIQSEFLSDVSHEVRNPIFSVSGYLEGLADSGLSDAIRRKFSEKGLYNLNRVQSLFDDLLDISRLEFGQGQNIYPDAFDVKGLVQEVLDSIKNAANAKGIQLDFNTHSVQVYADRKRIGQVLTNLAQNAVNYMDKPDGSISIRYRRYKDKLRIEVKDTGCGISEGNLERIFDRFFRVDKARSRDSGGTGLGLSICKKILEAHGEDIKVESTIGSGTRFWFELPLIEE